LDSLLVNPAGGGIRISRRNLSIKLTGNRLFNGIESRIYTKLVINGYACKLKRHGVDPAIASSLFLATVTDVASMGMWLALAVVLVK
jgi:hypothetical protein